MTPQRVNRVWWGPWNSGSALTVGDFGGTQDADLAIGIPGEDPPGEDWFGAGAVQVLYGSEAGLVSQGSQLLSQDTPGVGDVGEYTDWFASSLAGGDFNNDDRDDLAVVPETKTSTAWRMSVLCTFFPAAEKA